MFVILEVHGNVISEIFGGTYQFKLSHQVHHVSEMSLLKLTHRVRYRMALKSRTKGPSISAAISSSRLFVSGRYVTVSQEELSKVAYELLQGTYPNQTRSSGCPVPQGPFIARVKRPM